MSFWDTRIEDTALEALRLLTSAARTTGCRFGGATVRITLPSGRMLDACWTDDYGGHYVPSPASQSEVEP